MSDTPGMYSPPLGYTPQGQAVAQGMPNASNSQAPAGSPGLPSDQSLNSSLGAANQNLTSLGTADMRQQYVTNSAIPGMQTNYDDLARKLFDYDQGTLNPQFQGTNSGTPSDAASFGRVDSSPYAMTVGSSQLPSDQGLSMYASNPKYAYSSQIDQANGIASLLDTLNKGIGSTLGARIGTYKSDRQAAQDAVDTIMKVMGLKGDLASKQADIQSRETIDAADNANARILEGIKMGLIDPSTGLPYGTSKEPGAKGDNPQTPQAFADSFMGGYTRWADIPDTLKPAVTNLVKKQGGVVQKIIDSYQALDNSTTVINDIISKWQSMSDVEKHTPGQLVELIPGLSPTRAGINTTFVNNLEPELRKAVAGGRITQQEFQWIKNSIIPQATDSYESASAKINAVKKGLELKRNNPQYIIGSDAASTTPASSTTRTINGVSYTKVAGGWQKVK